MTKKRTLQILRGTTVQNDAYTGSAGELTMDTTTNELRLHDGSTLGGHIIGNGGGSGTLAGLSDVTLTTPIDGQVLTYDNGDWVNADKADIDAQNFDSTGKSYIAEIGMPSDTKDDITVGASGTTYQAPANGYFYASAVTSGSGATLSLAASSPAQGGMTVSQVAGSGHTLYICLPVRKGVSVGLWHYNTSSRNLRFVYAQGEI